MLWVVLAGMTGLAALAAVWPLIRGARRGAATSADAAFYKAQLGEIERDVARGFLPADEAAGARVEAARRLIAASAATADGADRRRAGTAARLGDRDRRRGAGRRARRSTPIWAGPTFPTRRSPRARSTRAACRGSKRRSPMSSSSSPPTPTTARPGRWSRRSICVSDGSTTRSRPIRQSLRLNGEDAARRADYGEALVGAAGGIVTADARAAFDKALAEQPGLPSARFYLGLAAEQDGDMQKAIAIYRALLGDAPPKAPWTPALQARLAALTGGGARADRRTTPRRPQDGAQQDAMIRGMVERLATRLATSGGGADEWRRLIRAYTVLHETDKAKDALASARKALAGDAEAGQQLDALARELGIGG